MHYWCLSKEILKNNQKILCSRPAEYSIIIISAGPLINSVVDDQVCRPTHAYKQKYQIIQNILCRINSEYDIIKIEIERIDNNIIINKPVRL
jgi:hypothetical protein